MTDKQTTNQGIPLVTNSEVDQNVKEASTAKTFWAVFFYLIILFAIFAVPFMWIFPEKKAVSIGLLAFLIDLIFSFKDTLSKPIKESGEKITTSIVVGSTIFSLLVAFFLLYRFSERDYLPRSIGIAAVLIALISMLIPVPWLIFKKTKLRFVDYERPFTMISAALGFLAILYDLLIG